ncbi:HD domain-containing protein [Rhizobium subbaraonis]|uniref:HD domain-containing protein n=1 Tax=Rhizobium subbaraonis TaxID=908946 RepID=A0A285TYQ5_9HYPH|nr:HD domain-containing protein [Rhizobium subbaraonis]
MNASTMLMRAVAIARNAHHGQLDKVGEPYFEHCRRVAEAMSTAEEKTVAYLHDVVEKTGSWTSARLAGEGFSRASSMRWTH